MHHLKGQRGVPLVVQWLELGASAAGARVQSVVRELRSCKPRGTAIKKKGKGPPHTEIWKTDIQETKKKAQSLNSGRDFNPHLRMYYRYVMYTFTNTSRVLMTLQYVQLTIMVY